MKVNVTQNTLRAAAAALSVVLFLLCGCSKNDTRIQPTAESVAATVETLPPETTLPVLEEGVISHNGKYYRLRED